MKKISLKKAAKAIKVAYNGVTNEEAQALVPMFVKAA